MEIKTLIKKLDISGIKVAWLWITNRDGLFEYVADKANTAVNALLQSNKTQVDYIRVRLFSINNYLMKFYKYVPSAWVSYADRVNDALKAVYDATADYDITKEEAKLAVAQFQVAYSSYVADDVESSED